ncbi:unnamed protein product [Withania somnifera]
MRDVDMREEEVVVETKVSDIREKMKEIIYVSYYKQPFNETKCDDYCDVRYFCDNCHRYSSFKFPILPVIDGVVKPCSYSNLENITNFQTNLIHTTQLGRLFRGTITKGFEERSVIVKTWDLLLPDNRGYPYRPSHFCDEIELYETANGHPHLAKLSRYCCEKRLAVAVNVATQLAYLLAWLHRKKIAVGSITASSIMIDKKENIKVFDFGCILHHVNEDSVILLNDIVARLALENFDKGMFT